MNGAVLVTGADGFIGTHLVTALRAAGYVFHTHSIADGDISRCVLPFDDVGHVFHLAARTFVPESWSDPRKFYEVNLMGTVNVLEYCRARGASLTLMSSYVYGRPRRLPVSEDEPLEAFNPYSHTKILAEETGRYYERQFQVPVTIVRPFNIYGPGQERKFLVPSILAQALDPQLPQITVEDLRPRRDYIYVMDLIDLLMTTVFRKSGGTFNAGSGSSWGVGEIISLVNELLPLAKPVRNEDRRRPNEVLDVIADISRARRELQWRPRVPFRDGLSETMKSMTQGANQQ
jgi:UDP-glucose 4-epimerase